MEFIDPGLIEAVVNAEHEAEQVLARFRKRFPTRDLLHSDPELTSDTVAADRTEAYEIAAEVAGKLANACNAAGTAFKPTIAAAWQAFRDEAAQNLHPVFGAGARGAAAYLPEWREFHALADVWESEGKLTNFTPAIPRKPTTFSQQEEPDFILENAIQHARNLRAVIAKPFPRAPKLTK